MNIIETNLSFNGLTYGNNPIMIVLHHAEASHCTVYDVHQWHLNNGWAGIGYHYFIDKQGNVYRGRPENAIGSHCLGSNSISIGICAEGDYTQETMPESQEKAIISLCRDIISRCGIKQIYGHKALYATECPGANYPLQDIVNKSFGKDDDIMDKIVLYFGDADLFAAVIVSQKEKCPLMLYQDFKDQGLKANKVIQIGGPGATAGGTNRFETFKSAATLL